MEQNDVNTQLAASIAETNRKLKELGQFCAAQQLAIEKLGEAVIMHQAQIEKLAGEPAAVN